MKHSTAPAFTLIELMVISAIVGMLVSGAAVAYFKLQTKTDLVAAGQRFDSVLKKADSMARSRIDKKKCVGSEEFQGYEVAVASGSMNATLKQICGGNFHLVETIALNENSSTSRDPLAVELKYKFYTFQSSNQNVMGLSPVVFTDPSDTSRYTVTINSLGVVSGVFSRP